MVPWLDEELAEWDGLTEQERERLRKVLTELGLELPDDEDPDYFE